MSTKIYNAYICDRVYSMHEMMQKAQSMRTEIIKLAQEKRKNFIISHCVHFQDFRAVKGIRETQNMRARLAAEKKESLSDYSLVDIWKVVAEDQIDAQELMSAVDGYFTNKAHEDGKSNRRIDSDFDFNCSMLVIPLEDKQLIMVFGNDDLTEVVKQQPWLSDYHYQNQTDHPAHISEEEWEERKKTWEQAIGPDYLPINHGMEIVLFNSSRDFFFDFVNAEFMDNYPAYIPSVEDRAKWLIDYCDDYPNPPTGSYSVEWVKYLRSPEYLNWKEDRLKQLKEKLADVSITWQFLKTIHPQKTHNYKKSQIFRFGSFILNQQ